MLETEPTDAQVVALAVPGESWESARLRASRLLSAVKQCRPCEFCDPEDMAFYKLEQGWVDETGQWSGCCPGCESDSYETEA